MCRWMCVDHRQSAGNSCRDWIFIGVNTTDQTSQIRPAAIRTSSNKPRPDLSAVSHAETATHCVSQHVTTPTLLNTEYVHH